MLSAHYMPAQSCYEVHFTDMDYYSLASDHGFERVLKSLAALLPEAVKILG